MTDTDAPGGAPLPTRPLPTRPLPPRRLGATGLAPTAFGFGAAIVGGTRGQFADDATAVAVAVAGADTPEQVRANVALARTAIPDAFWRDLAAEA